VTRSGWAPPRFASSLLAPSIGERLSWRRQAMRVRTAECRNRALPASRRRHLWIPIPFSVVFFLTSCTTSRIDLFPDPTGEEDAADTGRLTDAASPRGDEPDSIAAPDRTLAPPVDATSDAAMTAVDGRSDSPTAVGVGRGANETVCLSNADCRDPDLPHCEPTLQTCVQCLADADCAGNESKCNAYTNECVLPCSGDGDCMSPDVCDTTQGACTDCVIDAQCTGSERRCYQRQCVECVTSQDCAAAKQCLRQSCVACITSSDCPAGATCTGHECK
jgi:Cys-rich repeat protein